VSLWPTGCEARRRGPFRDETETWLYYNLERVGVDVREPDIRLLFSFHEYNIAAKSDMIEILFETMSLPSLAWARSTTMAAYAYGKHTCLSVDIGTDSIRVLPVVEGTLLDTLYRTTRRYRETAVLIGAVTESSQQYDTDIVGKESLYRSFVHGELLFRPTEYMDAIRIRTSVSRLVVDRAVTIGVLVDELLYSRK
jgi:hypothetical protein